MRAHLPQFTQQELELIVSGTPSESVIGTATNDRLKWEASGLGRLTALDYMSVAVDFNVLSSQVPSTARGSIERFSGGQKRILAFKSIPPFRPADEVKEEMINEYAKDGYYFLEDYIDIMMKPSRCTVV